jgi:hypothetical protein
LNSFPFPDGQQLTAGKKKKSCGFLFVCGAKNAPMGAI